MSDSYSRNLVLLELDAGNGETAYVTNNNTYFTVGTTTYLPSPAMEINPSAMTGDMDQGEYIIKALEFNTATLLARMAVNVPYSSISVVLKEVFLDDAGAVTKTEYLFKGLVYQVEVKSVHGYLDLICRDYLYYLDTTAGFACTEQCNVAYFGDDICQKTVQTEAHVIDSIDGFEVTLVDTPTLTTPFIFNNGYMEYEASRIKIRYHQTGKVFVMSRAVPPYWLGKTVTVAIGCNKTLETCRDIHNNEERFLGTGYAMVDYNPLYENP